MRPRCRTMPPMSWTSNGRMWTERQAASRATAKAGTSRSSVLAPASIWALSSAVLARSSASERAWICGSSSLMAATVGSIFLTSRSCWLPKILVRIVLIIEVLAWDQGTTARQGRLEAARQAPTTRSLAERFPSSPRGARGLRRAGRGVVEYVGEGVDGIAVHPDLVVEMIAGRAAGIADPAHDVAALDPLARADLDAGHVAVAGGDPEAVGDVDRLAQAGDLAGLDDDAVGARPHRLARRRGDIDALVDAAAVGEGVAAVAEAAGQDAAHRGDGGRRGDPAHPLRQPGLDRVQRPGEHAGPALQRRQVPGRDLVDRGAAADAGLGRAALQAVHAGHDGELAGALLVVDELLLEPLDARLEGLVRPAETVVLGLQAGDLDGVDPGAEVGPGEEGRGEGEEQEGGRQQADLQVRHPPLAQLGVGVGDDDDRVVPFRHELSYKGPDELDSENLDAWRSRLSRSIVCRGPGMSRGR